MKQPNNSGVISVSLLPAIGYIHGECNKISLKGCYFLRVLHSTLYHLLSLGLLYFPSTENVIFVCGYIRYDKWWSLGQYQWIAVSLV